MCPAFPARTYRSVRAGKQLNYNHRVKGGKYTKPLIHTFHSKALYHCLILRCHSFGLLDTAKPAMHVLFITKWYPGRNDPQLGVFIQKHALAVSSRTKVSVIFAHPVKDQTQDILIDRHVNDGVLELRAYYRHREHSNPFYRRVLNLWALRKAYRSAYAELVEERGDPDLNHVHILIRPILFALALRFQKGIPFVVSEQGSEFLSGKFKQRSSLEKMLVRWGMQRAEARTAVSTHLREGMKTNGIGGTFDIVPNVLPLEAHPVAKRGPKHHFLMVADLVDEIKNISGVLHAFHALVKTYPKLKLDIIGGGPDQEILEDLMRELDLKTHVNFHGRLPNPAVLRIMASCGSVIVNSRVETFSVVTGEALMFGKPVIATRCGGPNDMVNAHNGYLIPVNDRGALEEAIKALIEGHDSLDPAAIRASIGERCSSAAVADRFLSIYERILA